MVDECGGRPRAEGNVEQDISCRRPPAAPSGSRDQAANLLVAWPDEPELRRYRSNAPVGLSNGRGLVVEALRSRDKTRVDPRSEVEHVRKGAPSTPTRGAQDETKETK
jgi:hypothetical protein